MGDLLDGLEELGWTAGHSMGSPVTNRSHLSGLPWPGAFQLQGGGLRPVRVSCSVVSQLM